MENLRINCIPPITNPGTRRYNFEIAIAPTANGCWDGKLASVIDTGTVDMDRRPTDCDAIDVLDYYLNDEPYIYDEDEEYELIMIVFVYERDEDGINDECIAYNYMSMRDLPNARPCEIGEQKTLY